MERVVVFARGGAGKSTFALDLSRATGLPVVELDKQFWHVRRFLATASMTTS